MTHYNLQDNYGIKLKRYIHLLGLTQSENIVLLHIITMDLKYIHLLGYIQLEYNILLQIIIVVLKFESNLL